VKTTRTVILAVVLLLTLAACSNDDAKKASGDSPSNIFQNGTWDNATVLQDKQNTVIIMDDNTGQSGSTCSRCNGIGILTCNRCNGSGVMKEYRIGTGIANDDGLIGYFVDAECTTCNGSGEVTCLLCNGSGIEPENAGTNSGGTSYIPVPGITDSYQDYSTFDYVEDSGSSSSTGQVRCPGCNGTGQKICSSCNGTGKTRTYNTGIYGEAGGWDEEKCISCNGKGTYGHILCGGDGWI
jgi:DnaJ-class molecular chaperone